MNGKRYYSSILLGIFLSSLTANATALMFNVAAKTLVASLDGDANNNMGALIYKLPLQMPIGVNGMSPSIGINYNSGTNSGFSLYGLSTITRCTATRDIDGFYGYIDFSSTDRYCLDGQRLVAISGGDGEVGTVYSTEQKNFSKIVSHGGMASNPSTWQVRTKSGYILNYGIGNNAGDSQNNINYRWYLSSKEDRFGNKIQYIYKDLAGRNVLSKIKYNMHVVTFFYEDTGTSVTKYEFGKAYYNSHILKNIEVRTDGILRREYQLAYEVVGIANIHRLKSIQLCDEDGHCTKPTVFSWHEPDNANPQQRIDKTVYAGARQFINYRHVDVTADGAPEVCYYNMNGYIVCDSKTSAIGKTFVYNKDTAGSFRI